MKSHFFLLRDLGTLTAFAPTWSKDTVPKPWSGVYRCQGTHQQKNSGKMVAVILFGNSSGNSQEITSAGSWTQFRVLNSMGATAIMSQTLGYYVRGRKNRQVSWLSWTGFLKMMMLRKFANDYDLRHDTLDEIERIEVLKGAASTLYGEWCGHCGHQHYHQKTSKSPIVIHIPKQCLGPIVPAEASAYPLKPSIIVSSKWHDGILFYKAEAQHHFSNGLSLSRPWRAILLRDKANAFQNPKFNWEYITMKTFR